MSSNACTPRNKPTMSSTMATTPPKSAITPQTTARYAVSTRAVVLSRSPVTTRSMVSASLGAQFGSVNGFPGMTWSLMLARQSRRRSTGSPAAAATTRSPQVDLELHLAAGGVDDLQLSESVVADHQHRLAHELDEQRCPASRVAGDERRIGGRARRRR